MFFRPKPESAEIQHWIADEFAWAIDHALLSAETPLVLPTPEFFPAKRGASDQETVEGLIGDLKRHLGITHHKIAVASERVLPDQFRYDAQALSTPAGTWQGDEEGSLITYDPALIAMPYTLIAMLAHELMHQILHVGIRALPGDEDREELSTDLMAIAAGFGLIQVLGAEEAGWLGYMRQTTRVHALALFIFVTGTDPAPALDYLPRRRARELRHALGVVTGDPAAKALQERLAIK